MLISISGDFYYNYDGFQYWYNPCGVVHSYPCHNIGVPICQLGTTNDVHAIGYEDTMQWTPAGNSANVLYTTGDSCNRNSVVEIVCGSAPVRKIEPMYMLSQITFPSRSEIASDL